MSSNLRLRFLDRQTSTGSQCSRQSSPCCSLVPDLPWSRPLYSLGLNKIMCSWLSHYNRYMGRQVGKRVTSSTNGFIKSQEMTTEIVIGLMVEKARRIGKDRKYFFVLFSSRKEQTFMIDSWASIIWLKQSPTMSRTSKWRPKPCIALGLGLLPSAMVIWNVILSLMALFPGRQKPAVIGTISFTGVPYFGFKEFNAAFTKIPSKLWTAFITGFSCAGGSPITQQDRKEELQQADARYSMRRSSNHLCLHRVSQCRCSHLKSTW